MEFNSLSCANVLLIIHADVYAKVGNGEFRLGGQPLIMNLLPQIQRKEAAIYSNVQLLIREAYQINSNAPDIPNAYLQKS